MFLSCVLRIILCWVFLTVAEPSGPYQELPLMLSAWPMLKAIAMYSHLLIFAIAAV